MGACLHVVGLGPSGIEQITLGTYRLIHKAEKVFVRTSEHPCVAELIAEGVVFESFDEIYSRAETFEEVYDKIIDQLEKELKKGSDVIYAVPGHPSVAEKTVSLIWDKLSQNNNVIIHPAISFLDGIFCAVPIDPIEGLLVRNYDEIKDSGLTGFEWLVIPQVYDRMIASDLKLDLMNYYPDEAPVIVIRAVGTSEEKIEKILLFEMDHLTFDHLTTVIIPPNEGVASLARLTEIMKVLRSADGCPWDREQTHQTLKPYLIEESYEVLDAIDNADMYNLCEELGDLLLQVIFHSQIAFEAEEFNTTDVLRGIIDKLIRRHPHVFGKGRATTASEVIQTWEEIKKEEKSDEDGKDKGYFGDSKSLPSLMYAAWTQRKVSKVGFDWPDFKGPWDKVREELDELEKALLKEDGSVREELGDLLFSIANLARFLELDPEEVLRETVQKFQKRFVRMSELAESEGLNLNNMTLEQMDIFWDKAKIQEKSGNI